MRRCRGRGRAFGNRACGPKMKSLESATLPQGSAFGRPHVGRIWVVSTLGKGSIFQMELPTRAQFKRTP